MKLEILSFKKKLFFRCIFLLRYLKRITLTIRPQWCINTVSRMRLLRKVIWLGNPHKKGTFESKTRIPIHLWNFLIWKSLSRAFHLAISSRGSAKSFSLLLRRFIDVGPTKAAQNDGTALGPRCKSPATAATLLGWLTHFQHCRSNTA